MSGITATVLADSINPAGSRLTTLQLKFPRFILAELNTYRVFSRSARSSRAVPVRKVIDEVERDPVIPVEWGSNRRGMVAGEPLHPHDEDRALWWWLHCRDEAVATAKHLDGIGLTKQVVNRLLEPWMWAYVVVSSTTWGNCFAQRFPADAQPEMRRLAEAMADALIASEARPLEWGDWHLPYVSEKDAAGLSRSERAKVSAARCARVSYRPFDADEADRHADSRLADRLMSDGHWGPFEHQAMASDHGKAGGNFGDGWAQYRKLLPREDRADFDWKAARRKEVACG